HNLSSAVILYTEDGGQTWERRFRSTRTGEWAWKISFPTADVGYVSLQRNSQTPIFFLKTSDGGQTWEEKLFSSSYYFVQGIGFIDENRGWIGGNSTSPVFTTSDGGETWQPETIRPRLNRFRFLGDSLGYAVGRSVHKRADWTATAIEQTESVTGISLEQNYPNPFRESTLIRYAIPRPGPVKVEVFDLLGRRISTVVDQHAPGGVGAIEWGAKRASGAAVPPGTYFYRLTFGGETLTRSLQVVR
ncbi:MAG: T9SS type A sorting domain-containing protein, partial [Rhodothermales bacterium]|nr:T9SS type A sorting domain-containing protein [Rhodothermales bacterium]